MRSSTRSHGAGRRRERWRQLEAATDSVVHPGQPADEQTFNYRSEPPTRPVVRMEQRTARGGAGSFSFEVPVEASGAQFLVVTYHNDLGLPVLANFEIHVEGTLLARDEPESVRDRLLARDVRLAAGGTRGEEQDHRPLRRRGGQSHRPCLRYSNHACSGIMTARRQQDAYTPRAEHQFTFGLWTVGNVGRDPFGEPVRPRLPGAIVEGLAELGAYGVNLHDKDLVPRTRR